ncbi:MAG: signal peptidase II [Candidatus Krumholzibacteria bacterium]|jgi:signal peptidase II|nr:signal peptidase II [Candidatus Krumholzibacteria bacterium]
MRRGEPWLWAAGIWLVDFVTKRLVLAHADTLRYERVEVLGDFFRLIYVRNPGAAMGLSPFGRWTLVAISAGAVVMLCWFLAVTPAGLRWRRLAMGWVLGGALGNLVDRVFYDGLVVDFLDFGLGAHRFWAFNVADMGVTCGGLLLMASLLVKDGREGHD